MEHKKLCPILTQARAIRLSGMGFMDDDPNDFRYYCTRPSCMAWDDNRCAMMRDTRTINPMMPHEHPQAV